MNCFKLLLKDNISFKYYSNSFKVSFKCQFPERRQTMLFSATQTRKVEDLSRVALKKEPLYIGVDDQKDMATVEGLQQVSDM